MVMKNKNLRLILITSILIIAFSILVYGQTITLDVPSADADITGTTFALNATTTDTSTVSNNQTNVSFYYSTDLGVTWTFIGVDINSTTTDTVFNVTDFDTTAISDSESVIFNATWWNMSEVDGTMFIADDTSTSVDVDNNAPSAVTLTIDSLIMKIFAPNQLQCVVTDAGDSSTIIDLILEHPDGTRTVHTSNNDTDNDFAFLFENEDVAVKGESTAICQATDDVGLRLNSTSTTLIIKGGKDVIEETGGGVDLTGVLSGGVLMFLIFFGVFMIVVIGGVVWLLKKSKKSKRGRR